MNGQIFGVSKNEVTEVLRKAGINPTYHRIKIAHLMLLKPQHLSADEILKKLNEEYEQVSLATVYNTLKLFVEKRVIGELVFSLDRIYFDSNTSEHHHFIDTDTGCIIDLPADSCRYLEVKYLQAEIKDISLIIKGRLNSASENKRKSG